MRDGIGSILIHLLVVVIFFSLPDVSKPAAAPVVTPVLHRAVHIVAPRFFELTQTAPNQGKVSRELDVRSSVQTPHPQAPRFRPPSPPPGPVAQPAASAPVIEPPKIEVATSVPPPPVAGTVPQAPPPQEKPKLAFESVGSASRTVAPNPVEVPQPQTSLQDMARPVTRPGGGGVMVGDIGDDLHTIPNLNQVPSLGRAGSNLQLLSDPKGIDFKPYLIQILTAVRRNWMAVIPDSARLGRRGRVLIQFIIDRHGAVPKLVIAEGSGTDAFDRAAVAGISASYPFPPLPADYKGDQIRLQLAFSYNVPSR